MTSYSGSVSGRSSSCRSCRPCSPATRSRACSATAASSHRRLTGASGARWSPRWRGTWSTGTASTRSCSGRSKCGTSPTCWCSGRVRARNTCGCMTKPPAQSRASIPGCRWAARPPRRGSGSRRWLRMPPRPPSRWTSSPPTRTATCRSTSGHRCCATDSTASASAGPSGGSARRTSARSTTGWPARRSCWAAMRPRRAGWTRWPTGSSATTSRSWGGRRGCSTTASGCSASATCASPGTGPRIWPPTSATTSWPAR